MSMLSSMTEKLRETAHEVKRVKDNNADWLWRDGITLNDAVRELCDAADTIDYLRCTCNDLQTENDSLRERVGKLELENAMLRELVETMHAYYASDTVEDCDLCKWNNECAFEHDGGCRYDDIREDAAKEYFASEFSKLGIEVDNE